MLWWILSFLPLMGKDRTVSSLSLLIKPASSLCNLRCRYCFYHDLSTHRTVASYGLMSDQVLETLVRQAFSEARHHVTFAFQGGEPTLRGLDFYQRLIELVSRFNTDKIGVQYAIQTNGQVIDDDWADFLSRHHFLVGLSLDGPKDLHDSLRVDSKGSGSFTNVMQAVQHFKKAEVDFNILSVVSNRLARHPEKVYRFFTKQGFNYLQFIPCLPPLGSDPAMDPHAVSPRRYGDFLCRLFDLWYTDFTSGVPISIRLFDNWIRMLAGEEPEQCGLSGHCTCQMVVEADGSVYPCDFYVTDEWRIGYVGKDRFADMANAKRARHFVALSRFVPDECRQCTWYPLCRNGCRRDREITPEGRPGKNRFCKAYQAFFEYAVPRMRLLANQWRRAQGF